MTDGLERQHRRSVRLQGFDYSQPGIYFLTICAEGRRCLFGDVLGAYVSLSEVGRIVEDEWKKTAIIRPRVSLDQFIIMPNHLHGILVLTDRTRGPSAAVDPPTLERFGRPVPDSIPTIVRSFKAAATKRVNVSRRSPGVPLWQRGYYEHVIRTGDSLDTIRRYIAENPARWAFDRENPDATAVEQDDVWAGCEYRP